MLTQVWNFIFPFIKITEEGFKNLRTQARRQKFFSGGAKVKKTNFFFAFRGAKNFASFYTKNWKFERKKFKNLIFLSLFSSKFINPFHISGARPPPRPHPPADGPA